MTRINSYLQRSKAEFKQYQSNKQDIYLAQAGEKLWNVFNMLAEQIIKNKINSFPKLKKAVAEIYADTGSDLILQTFTKAYELHRYFYGSWTDSPSDVEHQYKETLQMIEILIKTRGRL